MPSTQSSSSTSSSGSRSKTAIVPGMMGVYNQLLGLNQQNYQNIQSGYAQGQQQLASQLNSVYAGYGTLESSVMDMLGVSGGGWGVATPGANAIRQGSTQTQGQTQQAMINAGLGNSTVLTSMRNQNQLQTNQAYGELGSKLADYAAGYKSQIGLARQQAMMQGAGLQAGMSNSYLNTLGGFKFGNTAGDLTGQFSQSFSNASSQAQGLSAENQLGGMGRPSSKGFMSTLGDQPNYNGNQQPYQPFTNDLSAINYAATRPQSFGYGGSSNVLNLSGGYGPQWAGMDPTQAGGGYNPYGGRGGGRTSSIA